MVSMPVSAAPVASRTQHDDDKDNTKDHGNISNVTGNLCSNLISGFLFLHRKKQLISLTNNFSFKLKKMKRAG